MNGDYAVWWACTTSGKCAVYRRTISTDTTVKVPNSTNKLEYAPSVTSDGTVTFARSGYGCGSGVTLRRWSGGSVTKLTSFPTGIDVGQSFAYTASTKTVVLFDRVKCKPQSWNVYEIETG